MNKLRISLLQTDICWENKEYNLRRLHEKLEKLSGTTEIVVLPEMFSTGFSMNCHELSEPASGATMQQLCAWASHYNIAIAGSYIASEQNIDGQTRYYNRAFFLTPDGKKYFYDKRHLFRMGHETECYSAGKERTVFNYLGWNIMLIVCYDLRFPVWTRNCSLEYDLLICPASWPTPRRRAWDILLQARALENSCYVCGINRIGQDGYNLHYNGGTAIYSPKAELLAHVPDAEEGHCTAELNLEELQHFRQKFPTWQDADRFSLEL